jgi:DNA-binding SARP family transcriptional activator/tetratricopeptide (TPR) repeat protein
VSVGAGVEKHETASVPSDRAAANDCRLRVQLLGPLAIYRHGVALPMPASRKVRAVIGYLALAPRAVGRGHLCEMLWDVPNDPRGELRWCLSKMRGVLDEPDRRRVETSGDGIALDLSDCHVDVLEIGQAQQQGIDRLAPERLRALAALFVGDFLEGLEVDRSPEFSGWLTAQRCRLRACRAAVLEHLVASIAPESDEVFGYLDELLQLAPFDRRAHAMLFNALAARGLIHEGDAHVLAAVRLFEAEGLDGAPLRESWKLARHRQRTRHGHTDVLAVSLPSTLIPAAAEVLVDAARRASIAVMPFVDRTGDATNRLADGFAHDVITRLAKLRNLFVIAHGTMSALGARGIGAEEAGRLLNVDYVAGGLLRRKGDRVSLTAELAEARSARIVWTGEFEHKLDDALEVLDQIGDRIVASIASEIELAERNRAILKPPTSMNAWEAYHRGLWHVYRYEPQHNRQATQFFEMAARLDPTWARALSALSFTHFQNAFQRWAEREPEIDCAFRAAELSLIADDRDPSAHWAMGRALWLRGRHAQSLVELEKAVELSPSFAHGHYTLAFVHAQSGDPRLGIGCSDHSRQLSPFDPLLCAMLATRALALVRLDRFDEAAEWALKAISQPNTFPHLRAIAAACLGLANRPDEGREVAGTLHRMLPHYRIDDLLTTFQFAPEAAELLRKGGQLSAIN